MSASAEKIYVARVNRLLESVAGIPLSIHSLDDCVPSLWVALTESLFDIKLAGIYKSHQHLAQGKKQDQENINKAGLISNSRLVLDTLSELLELDLSHLSAEALANGNPQESKFLIDILYQLAGLMGKVQDEVESVGEQDAGPPTIVAAIGEGEYDFDINEINDQGSYVEDDDYSGVEEGEDLEPQQQNSLATIDFEGQASPTPSTTTSSSIDHPSAQRRKRKTFVREVVEGDVTEFALEQEKRKATLRKPSTTETTEKAATASASQTRPKKKTRFNLKESSSTPPLLKITPADTPHMRALKMRRARLLRQSQDVKQKSDQTKTGVTLKVPKLVPLTKSTTRPASSSSSTRPTRVVKGSSSKSLASTSTSSTSSSSTSSRPVASSSTRSTKVDVKGKKSADSVEAVYPTLHPPQPPTFKEQSFDEFFHRERQGLFVDNDDDAEDEDYQADYQDYLLDKQSTSASRRRQVSRRRQGGRDGDDEISDENDPNYREKTVPEKNFSKFEGYISTLMPDIKAPAYLKDTAWAQQINIWRKALDDRLWNRQVNESKRATGSFNLKSLDFMKKEVEKSIRLRESERIKAARHEAAADLRERERRAVRMVMRQEQAEQEANKFRRKLLLEKEKLLQQSYKEYLQAQRQAIIEERRYKKEKKREEETALRIKEESVENYYRDQILLLEEKLTEAKRDQAIAERAQKNEMRRLVREHKSENKAQILRIKEKLAADAEDLMYQEAELDRLRALIRFELQ